MDSKQKAVILVQFLQEEHENPLFNDFFDYNDLGMPLAVAVEADLCNLTEEGLEVLNETYRLLCEELDISPDKDYESYFDMTA